MDDKIDRRLKALPNSADVWVMIIVVLEAFGKPIHWYVWAFLIGEVLLQILYGVINKLEAMRG